MLSVVLGLLRAEAQTPIIAGPLVNPANGHTYHLLAEDDWERSEATAVAMGGHLATVNDAAEQAWILDTFGSFDGVHRSLWIGLSDAGREGDFRWASGESPSYTHWLPGQPDNSPSSGGEDFVHMLNTGNEYGHPGGWWNDIMSPNTVFTTFDPICGVVEIEPVPPPVVRIRSGGIDGAVVTLSWSTRPGARYTVEQSSTLAPGVWSTVGVPVQGSGAEIDWMPPKGPEGDPGPVFFRVRPG